MVRLTHQLKENSDDLIEAMRYVHSIDTEVASLLIRISNTTRLLERASSSITESYMRLIAMAGRKERGEKVLRICEGLSGLKGGVEKLINFGREMMILEAEQVMMLILIDLIYEMIVFIV